ncbi:MAG: hypothetical protein P4M00_04475 [Azospirillaceae bacterium]|nr:hypothetical protein [Azospirillaceae bacterium]
MTLAPPKPRGAVSYAKLLLRWRDAQRRANLDLARFGQALLALEEIQRDPRLPQLQRAAAKMTGLVPKFGDDLADHLDTAMTRGDSPDGKAALREALGTLAAYRRVLDAVPALADLEAVARRAVGGDLQFHSGLAAALSDLEAEVTARLR